ncbi:VTT domain-containing protein [Sphingomonas sp. RHCKR7]|uniref:DedA family protein n=1 Tax=Sphingomonas folli TaxID=2862497 RepID=UPI001CA53991|nr:VTT domain-containing protein [Sphingomonas folli]MBW6527346.1 VTT domain-containing protein [Sphingomonas folli]
MTIEAIVARYGLAAVFAGAALEGEAAVIAGGLLAHQEMFPLAGAMAAAAAGSFTADQAYFYAGRRFRDHRWVAAARERPAFARAMAALERHPVGFIFAFRFLYGLRTISPIAIGTAGIRPRLYAAVNAVSAMLWAITFTTIGFVFGDTFEAAVGRLRHDPRLWWLAGSVVAAGAAVALVHRIRSRRA